MSNNLPLSKMSTGEKILAMESIWDDLCHKADSVSSPEWHEKVLAEREVEAEEKADPFNDWETTKEYIRIKIS